MLSPEDGKIDQVEGANYAAAEGYNKFAVTVADAAIPQKNSVSSRRWPVSG